jgi:hypothetical protein
MASSRAQAEASRLANPSNSNSPTCRKYTLQNPPAEQSMSESSWEQHDDLDTPSSGDESFDQADIRLLPLKEGRSQNPQPSSSKTNDTNSVPIDVPDDERDVSKRIKDLLRADRTLLSDSFATDLEDGDSGRSSLALSGRYSDDYGLPSDKGLLLNHKKSQDEDDKKSFGWRSLFRLHSWWSVLSFFIMALVVVWVAIRGLPWSSAGARGNEFVSCPFATG